MNTSSTSTPPNRLDRESGPREGPKDADIRRMPMVGHFHVPPSLSLQAEILLRGFAPFYTKEILRDFLAPTLSKAGALSFRVINYAVTTFALRRNLAVVDTNGTVVNLYYDYKRKLGKSHRRNFDCFKRWERVYFFVDAADGDKADCDKADGDKADGDKAATTVYSSTVGQLHFMRWAHQVRLFDLGPDIMDEVVKEMAQVGEERRRLQREQAAQRGHVYVPKKRGRKPKVAKSDADADAAAAAVAIPTARDARDAREKAPSPPSFSDACRKRPRTPDDEDDDGSGPKRKHVKVQDQDSNEQKTQKTEEGRNRCEDTNRDAQSSTRSAQASASKKKQQKSFLRKPSRGPACTIYDIPQRVSTIDFE